MIDALDTLKELDYNEAEDATLLKLENDIFDTAVLVYHRDSPDEEVFSIICRANTPKHLRTFRSSTGTASRTLTGN